MQLTRLRDNKIVKVQINAADIIINLYISLLHRKLNNLKIYNNIYILVMNSIYF